MTDALIEDYFPQGIAIGEAFIGRAQEVQELIKNIESGHHTLLLAPRRYGKTSLVVNTLRQLKLPYVEINFYLALSAKSVEKKILVGVQELLGKVIKKPEQILKSVQFFLQTAKKRWTLGFKGVLELEISPDDGEDNAPDNVLTALKLIEHILHKKQQRAIIFIDEIQEIYTLHHGKQLQGAIREFAQISKRLVFIFSGSNRRMLQQMFDDRSMPLYELCDRVILDRISPQAYGKYLNKVAEKTWKRPLEPEVLQKIIELSECHPKRIYNICYYLWRSCQEKSCPPKVEDVESAWNVYVKQRVKDVRYHLSRQSAGQIKILTLLATGLPHPLTGRVAQRIVNLSGPSIVHALKTLEENDYIEKDLHGVYRIIDPLIRAVLAQYERQNLED